MSFGWHDCNKWLVIFGGGGGGILFSWKKYYVRKHHIIVVFTEKEISFLITDDKF